MKSLRPSNEAVIELGKRILAQFSENDDRSILTSWLSHHIALLISEVDRQVGTPNEMPARQACSDEILKLWAHRNHFPDGSRPFQGAEAAAEVLASLAPDAHQSIYFNRLRRPLEPSVGSSSVEVDWLKVAEAFDRDARKFVRLCMNEAISEPRDELLNWLQLTEEISDENSDDVTVVRLLVEGPPEEAQNNAIAPTQSKSALTISRLDGIIDTLVLLRDDLKEAASKSAR